MTYYNDNLTSIRSSFGTASSSSSQVVPAEDTDVGNDQVMHTKNNDNFENDNTENL